jgi:GntR family transcriptional regulator
MAVRPMYQQIADDLRAQIEAGALAGGTQMPTEIELQDRYNASRNTVRDAIKRLISVGLVETRPGQGTFVRTKTDPFVTVLTAAPNTGFGGGEGATYLSQVSARHRRARVTTPKIEVLTPPETITRRLRVEPNAQVVSRHQERYIDDIPWSLQTSFYPMEFITRGATRLLMAADIEQGTAAYLAESLGVRQTGYRDWITVRVPDATEQASFGLAHDATVFEIFRTAFDQTQTPMRVTVTVFPADRNQFIVDVGDGLPEPAYDDPSDSSIR